MKKLRWLAAGVLAAFVPAGLVSAEDPAFGTPEFLLRDVQNMEESTRRMQDMATNPAFGHVYWTEAIPVHVENYFDQLQHPDRPVVSLSRLLPGEAADAYRQNWGGSRGTHQQLTFINSCGARIHGSVFAVIPDEGPVEPMPGIVITTGSIDGYEEMYWWAAQGLAEAGYVVMTYDIMGQGDSEERCHDGSTGGTGFDTGTVDAIRFFFSNDNPMRGLFDGERLGIAGHSAGAFAVSTVGHRATLPIGPGGAQVANPVDAVVGWDGISNVYDSDPDDGKDTGLDPRVPTMSQNAEYFFNPVPRSGPATNMLPAWFKALRAHGVPAMHVALRAATHIEWTFVPYILPATRQGERVAMYYTLAWFDRFVKGDTGAAARLEATVFDDSADVSSIGAGCYDLESNENIPYTIAGECVADHLSIYNLSAYDLGANESDDMRGLGCPSGSLGFEEALPCGGPLLALP